jgi:AAA15 family ATPase/GTPase
MTNEHITRLEVTNFKKFDRLVVDNIGQVNLITGDNNVGKTSLLEVLLLNENIKDNLSLFYSILKSKNPLFAVLDPKTNNPELIHYENVFAKFLNDYLKPFEFKIRTEIKETSIRVENIKGKLSQQSEDKKTFVRGVIENYPEISSLSENWLFSYVNGKLDFVVDIYSTFYKKFLEPRHIYPYISGKQFYDIEVFSRYVNFTPEQELNVLELLKVAFQNLNISKIRLWGNDIQIVTGNRKNWHSIADYGDGVVRILRIIINFLDHPSHRMMIDELDMGVHYLRQKSLFKILFRLAKETNIQLFCTTHSQDCIKAFVEAAEEMSGMKDKIRLIELEEFTKDNKLQHTATTYEFDALKYKLEVGTNVRGGDVWQ